MLSPQKGATIAANLVEDNDNPDAPPIPKGFFGGGIVVGGGLSNLITKNVVQGHSWAGIAIMSISDVLPAENRIIENESIDNETDLLFIGRTQDVLQNCFQGNKFLVSTPRLIEQSLPCDGESQLSKSVQFPIPAAPPGPDYRRLPAPGAQQTMPNGKTAPVRIPMGEPVYPSVNDLRVPSSK
jgi:hypothetical protein